MTWDHKNPEKRPIPTPTCFGTAEPCQECGSCWLYNDCYKSNIEIMILEAEAARSKGPSFAEMREILRDD